MKQYPNFYDKFDKKKKGRKISPTYARVRTRESQPSGCSLDFFHSS